MIKKMLFGCLLLPGIAFAKMNIQWLPIQDAVLNYAALQQTPPNIDNQDIQLPNKIMIVDGKKVYIHVDQVDKMHVIISFDTTQDCHGVKYCSIGFLQAEVGANPEIYYDMKNQELTKRILLNNAIPAYFTPSHAMGDYWPAMIAWRNANVLYTLSWNLPTDKSDVQETLMREMANDVGS